MKKTQGLSQAAKLAKFGRWVEVVGYVMIYRLYVVSLFKLLNKTQCVQQNPYSIASSSTMRPVQNFS